MSERLFGSKDDTERAEMQFDLQFHSGTLIGGEPPASDPNPAPAPTPAEPPKPEPAPADPPKPGEPEPKPGEPPEDPENKEPEKPEGAPEKYELTVPEGLTLNEAGLEKVTGLFKELNLTNEQAQRLVDAEGEYIKEMVQKQNEAWQQTVDGWKEDATKEFGTKLQEELSNVARVFNQFATPEEAQALKEDLEWSGLGNKKEWIRFLSKIGKQLAEDKLVEAQPIKPKKSIAEVLYPDNP
jgi:hypothetical protein